MEYRQRSCSAIMDEIQVLERPENRAASPLVGSHSRNKYHTLSGAVDDPDGVPPRSAAGNLAIHHASVIFGYRLVDAAADIKAGDPAASSAGRAGQYQSLTAGNRRLPVRRHAIRPSRAGVDAYPDAQMRQLATW